MAGYTRQSSFSDGDTIAASLLNNEYDQLLAAFNVSTGHTHDGSTTGDGGPISTLYSNAISFGTNADTDIVLTFNANTADGVLTWMEDEDYFKFSDDILINSTEKLYFYDAGGEYISGDGSVLSIAAGSEIDLTATTIDMNGAADISGNLAIGGNLTVTGNATINGNLTFGNADTDTVSFGAEIDSHIVPDDDDTYDLGSSTKQWRNVYVDGTLEADAITVDGTALNEYIADTIGAMVSSNTETGIGVTYEDSDNTLDFVIGSSAITNAMLAGSIADSKLSTITTADKVSGAAIQVDGATDGTSITVATTDKLLVDDGGTTKYINISQLPSTATAADDISTGDAAVNLTTTAGNITIDAQGSDTDIIFKGTDSSSDITALTLDMSEAGAATFNNKIVATELDISGDVDIDGTLETDALTINGTSLSETIADTVGAMVSSNTETGITVTYEDGDNTLDFALGASQTTITSLLATDIKIGEDDQTKIDFETADEIHFYAANAEQVYVADGIFGPQSDSDVDLGSSSVRWKDAYVDSLTTTGAVTVGGDLTVNGTTTTVNSTTVTIDDPIFTLGGDSAPGSDDNKDRGIEFRYHDGSSARVGFFGYDDSATGFTFLTAATNSSEVFSGTEAKLIAGELDISGNADIDGTLEADAITVDGTALNEYIADTVGAMVSSNTETNITVSYDDSDNTLDFVVAAAQTGITSILNTALVVGRDSDNDIDFATDNEITFRAGAEDQIVLKDGVLEPVTDDNVDLGTSSKEFKDGYFDGTVYADAINLNGTAITSTAAELNILDGVTSTATELNIIDGDTTATSTTLADADRVVVNDAGTMKQVALTDVTTYINSNASFASKGFATAMAIAL